MVYEPVFAAAMVFTRNLIGVIDEFADKHKFKQFFAVRKRIQQF
jgi:hypothetical protein